MLITFSRMTIHSVFKIMNYVQSDKPPYQSRTRERGVNLEDDEAAHTLVERGKGFLLLEGEGSEQEGF